MLLRALSGAVIDARDDVAPVYIRCGFVPVEGPQPKKTAPRKRADRTRKAAPKD